MATYPLPSGHPNLVNRPGYQGFENPPTPAIVNVTLSSSSNNSITLNLYGNKTGNWSVTTPAGLTVLTNPVTNTTQTSIVYTGGITGTRYTFNNITLVPTVGSAVSIVAPPLSITL